MELRRELTASVGAVRDLFGAAACSCALVDERGEALEYVAAAGEGATEIVGVELPGGRGIAGWVATSGQALAVRDVRSDPRFARDVAESTHYVPRSMMAAPMFDQVGETLGVVSVLDPTVDEAAEWTLAVLGAMAQQLGAFIVALRRGAPGAEEARLVDLGRRVLAAVEESRR